MQKLQNFAGKVAVGGARRTDHASPIIERLKWLPMEKKYIYEVSMFIYKVKVQEVPEWLFEFPTANDVRGTAVVTRQNNKLFIPRTRTNNGARSLYVEGPRLWNALPDGIRNCQTISTFSKELYHY